MSFKVTMPQLGMAQDSGIIVKWLKQAGDKVAADDILMEVETDKSTMEVEVGADGYVSELRAPLDMVVPVGDVVAVISDEPGVPVTAAVQFPGALPDATTMPVEPSANTEQANLTTTVTPSTSLVSIPPSGGRILASPKAKVEAARRGLLLENIVAEGRAQPLHLSDIINYQPPELGRVDQPYLMQINALKPDIEELVHLVDLQNKSAPAIKLIWAAFFTAAVRAGLAMERNQALSILVSDFEAVDPPLLATDADLSGIGAIKPVEQSLPTSITVVDCRQCELTQLQVPWQSDTIQFVLTKPVDGGISIGLQSTETALPALIGLTVLRGLVSRIERPFSHLV